MDFRYEYKRYRKRSPDNTRAGAQAFEALLRRRLARGEPMEPQKAPPKPPECPTFAVFAREWFETYVKANNKPSEQYNKSTHLNKHLIPFLGKLKLGEITAEHVERFKAAKRKAGLAEKTINLHLGCLAKCLRTALEWGRIDRIPEIKKLKTQTPEMDFLSPQDSDRLLAYAHKYEPLWHPMILTALRTGMRRGELIGLQWDDVDLKRRKITVRRSMINGVMSSTKNYRTRYSPMTPEVYETLSRLTSKRGFVFKSETGGAISSSAAHRNLKGICEAAGLRPIQWHAFRHTFASQLATSGLPLNVLKDLMGHSDIQMTMRYSHFSPSLYDGAVDVLDVLGKKKAENFGQQVVNTPKIALPEPEILPSPIPQIVQGCQQKQATV